MRKKSKYTKSSKNNWLGLFSILGMAWLFAGPGFIDVLPVTAKGGGGGGGGGGVGGGGGGGGGVGGGGVPPDTKGSSSPILPRLMPRVATTQPLREYADLARVKTGVIADPYALATKLPLFPPGTSSLVREAAEKALELGRLTARQSEAVSQLYAPLYFSEGAKNYPVPSGGGSVNIGGWDYTPPPGTTNVQVTDFGTPEAAQAALDAYMANFV